MKMTSKSAREKADRLGESYLRLREQIKAASKTQELVSTTIKALADDFAVDREAKQRVVHGSHFIVGYTFKTGTPTINFEALFKKYPHFELALTSRTVDEAKVEKAVSDGILTNKVLSKFLIPSTKVTKAVYVAEKA